MIENDHCKTTYMNKKITKNEWVVVAKFLKRTGQTLHRYKTVMPGISLEVACYRFNINPTAKAVN